jgi:hypothetical protein
MSLASRHRSLLRSVVWLFAFVARGAAEERNAALECERVFSGTQRSLKAGRPLEARSQASVCIQVCPDFTRSTCLRWRQDAEQAIPSVLFALEGAADAAFYIDGTQVSEHLDGLAHEVEPGPHQFEARTANFPHQAQQFVVLEGARRQRISFRFPPMPPPVVASSSVRPFAWVGGGVALAGSIVGTTAGLLATRYASTVRANCPGQICPPPFHDDLDAMQTSATVSTLAFAVAGGGLVTMVIGLLLPSQSKSRSVGVAF